MWGGALKIWQIEGSWMDISVVTVAGDHRARQKLSLSNIDVSFPKYSNAIGLCLQSSSESTWWLRQSRGRGQAQPRRLGGMFGKRDVAKHQGPLLTRFAFFHSYPLPSALLKSSFISISAPLFFPHTHINAPSQMASLLERMNMAPASLGPVRSKSHTGRGAAAAPYVRGLILRLRPPPS